MAYQDRDTYVTTTTRSGAGWFIAGAVVVAMIVAGVFYANGYFQDDNEVSIELKLPDVDAPKLPLPTPAEPAN